MYSNPRGVCLFLALLMRYHLPAGAAEAKPVPPQNLKVIPSGPSIILVMWGESSSADVDHYYVYMEDEDMEDTATHNFYMWEGLEDCTIYTFGVKTVSSSGVMSDPALADGETDAGYPPEPQGLRVKDYTYNAVTLVWEKPATLCDIEQYRVTYQENGSMPEETLVKETTVEVSQLKPETLYTFKVSASTSLGQGPAASTTQITMAVHAAGDKPDPPPDLTLVSSGPSIMLVTWGKSSSADVDHYYVYVEDEDMKDATVHNFYMWEGLEDCTFYTFGVKTVLSSGVMSDPALADGETDAGYPPEPQGLRVGNYTYNAVTLVWEKPATLCDIVQYRVTYQNNGSLPKNTLVDETTVEVSQLKPETLYTFNVSASTSLGQGPAASITQTTMAVPGPPQDLVAEGVSSSAINVSWSPPVVTPENYYVSVEIAGIYEKRVFDTQYLVENLKPCKTYEITVSSYYIETGESFPARVVGETKGDIPSAPTDCSVQAYKSYISVTWQKPSSYCALGPYSVDWTVKKLWGDGEEKSYNETINGLSHSIFDPPPYHSYTFEIAASVDGIFGDSTSCSGNSLDTNPGPPVLVSVVAEAQGDLRVTWEPPVEKNGQIIEYGIFVDSSTNFVKNVSGEVHTTTVIVEPCVSVSLSVAARNHADKDDGWGQRSEEKEVIPPGDVLPDSVECYNSARDVQACWLPYNKYCPVSQYNLQWEGKVLWSPGTTDSKSTTLDWSPEEFCYNISSIPYTNYRVSLSVGTNTHVSVTCSSTSPMAAPGPPTLEEIQAENLTINVTWKEPQQKNGIISNYRVEWTDWDGNTDSKVTDGSTYSYQIMLNSCGGEVDVIVSAKTSDVEGFGERSQPGRAFLVNSISHLSCNAIAPDEVALSWELQNSKCSVDYYNVTWSFNSLWSDDKGSGFLSVNGNDLSTTVGNLIPYSEISVAVHISNSPLATVCNTITQEENAGPPVLVSVVVEDQGEVRVTWEPPAEENGQIIEYGIFVDNSTNFVNNVSGEVRTTTVIVEPCVSVYISVAARNNAKKNDGWGQRSEEMKVTDDADVLPERLDCLQPAPDVRVCWRPYRTDCPVSQYNLQWEGKVLWSPGTTDTNSTTLGWSKDEICYNISSIPYTEYIVRLSVGTNTEKFLSCSTITPMAASSPPTKLQQIAKEVHSVTVEWSLPEFPRGELSGWYLYWTTAIGHFVGEHVTESPDERVMEIRSLQPSEVYYVYVMAVNDAGRGEEAVVEVATQYVP